MGVYVFRCMAALKPRVHVLCVLLIFMVRLLSLFA